MINKELFYKVTLIDCNGKELEVAKFLQILTGMEKTETRRIVASLPCVLYEELDGEACSYIEEALDFYTAKYKFEPVGDEKEVYEVDPSVYPSKQVIALGSMVDYIGKRSEFVSIARKYDFPKNVSLNDTPFLVKDGLAEGSKSAAGSSQHGNVCADYEKWGRSPAGEEEGIFSRGVCTLR